MNTSASQPAPFAAPDRAIMDAARQHIHTQITSLTLDFLPAMKDKLQPLKASLNAADSQFVDNLAAIAAQLNTFSHAALDRKQQQIEAEQSLSDEQKNQALTLLNAQRARQVLELTNVLANAAQAIARTTDELQQINLQLTDSQLAETLQRQLDSLTQQSDGQKAEMDKEAEDRRLLDETVKTFEQYNLADLFKEALPTTEELSAIAIPSPHLMALQLGIGRLQTLLGKLSSALKYSDLIAKRDQMRHRYNTLLAESQTVQKEAKAITRKLDELATLARLDNNRIIWVQQSRQFSDSLYRFLENDLSNAEDPTIVNQQVDQFSAYMKSIYSITRTV
ncbi:alpha-xenorhabdolysin family binary toxin subunit B [Pseudomonas sp. CDFA 610]|uniref:alpha-xenorhabdolysin family binary toxin subunit B n=1 Tax=Pseudomonas sp. CDFA 610 TaxID=2829825 RepID=UPI001E53083E|nr:alpha-xenorhabdolysin family binary toxin subunit B [Pseudomonas sp. CDFA 610]MCD5984611.1 alpha-xenorhabdolysin family binary toxin subunit B [Pseudomonas sp. CDFA 610]